MDTISQASSSALASYHNYEYVKSRLIWIYDKSVAPHHLSSTSHVADQAALLLRKGSVHILNDKGAVTAKEGEWIFPREGERTHCFSPDAEVLSLHFEFSWIEGSPLYDWDVALVFEEERYPELEHHAKLLYEVCNEGLAGWKSRVGRVGETRTSLESYFQIQSLWNQWLCTYTKVLNSCGVPKKQFKTIDERVIAGIRFLDQLSLSSGFFKKQFAEEIGLSMSQIDRLFIKEISVTPYQYFDQRKMERAMVLLQMTTSSIKEIAFELGFNSASYFSSWFTQKMGFPPSRVREENEN